MTFFIINIMASFAVQLKDTIFSTIASHCIVLSQQIDPIVNSNSRHFNKKSKYHFGFALCIVLLTGLYGRIALEYEGTGKFGWNQLFYGGPFVFTHQIVPKLIWFFFDMGLLIDEIGTILIFATLIFKKSIKKIQKISTNGKLVLIGSKPLEARDSDKMLKLRDKVKFVLYLFLIILSFLFIGFFLHCLWFVY